MFRRIAIAVALITLAAALPLHADEFLSPLRPYDSIQAGLDAHAVGEARRLDAINRQLGWNELFRGQAAAQRSSSIFYDPYIPGFDYAFRLGHSGVGFDGWSPSALDFRPIWGFGYYEAIRQPIGQQQLQTGPNRWESHPIYAEDVAPQAIGPIAPRETAIPTEPARPRGREF